MKKKAVLTFIIFLPVFIFCNDIEYVITNNEGLDELIKINTQIKVNEEDIFYSVNNKAAQTHLYVKYNNKNIRLTQKNVELSKSKKIFSDSNFREYIPVWYFTALKEKNRDIIFSNQPKWTAIKNKKNIDASPWEDFESTFWPESFTINNIYFFLFRGQEFPISKIESEKEIFKVYIHRTNDSYITNDYPYPDEYEKCINDEYFVLLLKFDGDYADVWINTEDSYIGKYALASYEICLNIKNLMNGNHNYTNITWPRHADGTSDYEDITPAAANETADMEEAANETATEHAELAEEITIPKPAPAIGKTAVVTENLRLRTSDKTTAEVVTTLAARTRVKVLAPGREDTIDGIASNWVQVSVLDGAKDKDGNAVAAGTKGWLFGGYLSEAESVESEMANEEASTAKEATALPIVLIAAGGAGFVILLAVILLASKKRKNQ